MIVKHEINAREIDPTDDQLDRAETSWRASGSTDLADYIQSIFDICIIDEILEIANKTEH